MLSRRVKKSPLKCFKFSFKDQEVLIVPIMNTLLSDQFLLESKLLVSQFKQST